MQASSKTLEERRCAAGQRMRREIDAKVGKEIGEVSQSDRLSSLVVFLYAYFALTWTLAKTCCVVESAVSVERVSMIVTIRDHAWYQVL